MLSYFEDSQSETPHPLQYRRFSHARPVSEYIPKCGAVHGKRIAVLLTLLMFALVIGLQTEKQNAYSLLEVWWHSLVATQLRQQLDGEMYNDNIAFAYSDSTDRNLYTD